MNPVAGWCRRHAFGDHGRWGCNLWEFPGCPKGQAGFEGGCAQDGGFVRHLFGHILVVGGALFWSVFFWAVLFWAELFWAGSAAEEVGCCGDWAGGGWVEKVRSERRGKGTRGH